MRRPVAVAEFLLKYQRIIARLSVAGLVAVILVSLQAALFYTRFAPKLEAVNAQIFDLVVDKSTGERG